MITRQNGLLVPVPQTAAPVPDAGQERERLRRELLRRIMDREARRRALRSGGR